MCACPVIVHSCRRALLCLSCVLDQLSLFYEDAFESTPQDLHALQVVVAVVMIPPIWSTSSRYLSTYGIPVGKNNQRSLPPSPLEVPDHVFPALAATWITPFLSAGVKPNKTAPSSLQRLIASTKSNKTLPLYTPSLPTKCFSSSNTTTPTPLLARRRHDNHRRELRERLPPHAAHGVSGGWCFLREREGSPRQRPDALVLEARDRRWR